MRDFNFCVFARGFFRGVYRTRYGAGVKARLVGGKVQRVLQWEWERSSPDDETVESIMRFVMGGHGRRGNK